MLMRIWIDLVIGGMVAQALRGKHITPLPMLARLQNVPGCLPLVCQDIHVEQRTQPQECSG